MKILVQPASLIPGDYIEHDSADWSSLTYPRIQSVNIQGVNFDSFEEYAVEDIARGGVRLYAWHGPRPDYPGEEMTESHGHIWTFYPLARDRRLGGAINTRQSKHTFYEPTDLRIWNQPLAGMEARSTFAEFRMPSALVKLGVETDFGAAGYLSEQAHMESRRSLGWRYWTEGLPGVEIIDGLLRPQRDAGRWAKAKGTITYFQRDTNRASGVHTADHEDALELTTGSFGFETTTVPMGGSMFAWLFTTPANQPGSANWPNGLYRIQLDVATSSNPFDYGFLTLDGLAGHMGRVNAALTSDLETWTQTQSAFSGTGLRLASRTIDPSAGAADDRFEGLLVWFDTCGCGGTVRLDLNISDSFVDGPWTAPPLTEAIDESVGVTDSTPVKQGKGISEAVGVTDSTPIKQGKGISEAVGLGDVVSPAKAIKITISEAVGVTDFTRTAFEITLGDTADPGDDNDHELQVRARVATGAATLVLELRQGSTLIQQFTQALTTAFADYVLDVTAAASISDYNDLRIYGYVDDGATGQTQISRLRLCLPAAGVDITRVITEVVGISDSTPIKLGKGIAEATGVTDSTTRVHTAKRPVSEAVGIGDLISTVKAITPAITEAVGLSDTIATIKTIISAISDDVGVTDDTTAAKTARRTPTDPVGITDSTSRVVEAKRTVDEAIGLTDLVSPAKTIRITITEAVGLSDVVDDKLTIAADISEAVGLTDSTTRVHGAKRTPTEAVGIGDVIAAVKTITPAITEALGVTDTLATVKGMIRTISEAVGVTDLIAAAKTITPAIAEALGLTDSTSAAKSITQSISESVGVTDPVTAAKTIRIIISESVGVTELVVDVLGGDSFVTISEPVGITDTTVRVHGGKRTPTEAAGVTDTTTRILDAKRTVDEAVGLTDTVLPAKSIVIVISEAVGVTDVITPAKTITTTITESVSVTDLTSRIADFVRGITEALGMTDTITSVKTVRRSVDDPVGLLDVIADVLTGAPPQTPISRVIPHQGVTVTTIPGGGRTEGAELE